MTVLNRNVQTTFCLHYPVVAVQDFCRTHHHPTDGPLPLKRADESFLRRLGQGRPGDIFGKAEKSWTATTEKIER